MKKALLFVFVSILALSLFAQPSFIKDSLDQYILQGMKDWDIPGLAIVIVKDGEVVYRKGFGVRDVQTHAPVDENTLFFIASNTKLFTGTALAKLAYQHTLSLDDKITKYFPAYRLYDTCTTNLLTLRDLLSHRIGTKTFQGDFTFWNSSLSRQEIMNRMQLLKPEGRFRQDYGYCNSCFLAAGEVIPKVTGTSWEQYIHDSLVAPVGMTQTLVSSNNLAQHQNIAVPYTNLYTGTLKRVPYDQWDNLGPAASIASNVADLSKWLLFQLDSGRVNGRQVIAWPVLQATRKMNTIVAVSATGTTHFVGYGLGLFMKDYRGKMVYYHGGGAAGMISNVTFLPEEKLGLAILTNNDNHGFLGPLQAQIMDAYLGVPFVNKSTQALPAFRREMKTQLDEIAGWEKRVAATAAPANLSAYAGEYENKLYGSLTIMAKNGRLSLTFHSHPNLTATMQYIGSEEWLLKYDNIEYGIFSTNFNRENGRVTSVVIKENDFVEADPYTFFKK